MYPPSFKRNLNYNMFTSRVHNEASKLLNLLLHFLTMQLSLSSRGAVLLLSI